MKIRKALIDDVEAATLIFNEAISLPSSVWRDSGANSSEVKSWLPSTVSGKFAFLVAESSDGNVMGFGCLGAYKPSPGYGLTMEISIYVSRDYMRMKVATQLIFALIEKARLSRQVMSIVASIDSENEGSIELHRQIGFEKVGEMKCVGLKNNQPRDLQIMQYLI